MGLPPGGLAACRLGNAVGIGRQRHDSIAPVDHDPGPRISHPRLALTTEADRALAGARAELAAAIERAAADLGLAEEPSGFRAALEAGAPGSEPPPPAPDPPRG